MAYRLKAPELAMTLEEIGEVLGVQGARVRQIEAKALRRLRDASRIHYLGPFAEDIRDEDYGVLAPGCRRLGAKSMEMIEEWIPQFWRKVI